MVTAAPRGPEIILKRLVRPRGFEPLTPGLGILCSIRLSYGRILMRCYSIGRRRGSTEIPPLCETRLNYIVATHAAR